MSFIALPKLITPQVLLVGRALEAMRSLAAAVLLVASATASEVPATTLGRPSVPPSGMRTAAAAVRLKPASQLCTEEAKRAEPGGALETCAQVRRTGLEPQSSRPQAASSATHTCAPRLGQGFERGVPCKTLYRTHSCCTHCDPCGFDGRSCNRAATNPWLSPQCTCEQVVLSGGCSYKGCAKPDALGVFSRSANWRTADGRYVYARDEVRPPHTLTLALATTLSLTSRRGVALSVKAATKHRGRLSPRLWHVRLQPPTHAVAGAAAAAAPRRADASGIRRD